MQFNCTHPIIHYMENQELIVKLVEGEFTPVQASDIMRSLIKQKINFHKIESLQKWERNHDHDHEPIGNRIEQLQQAEKDAKAFIIKMKKEGKKIRIHGSLTISSVED